MRKVFISYAREDRDYARDLADTLAANGFDAWWDWKLIGGTDFRESVREKLDSADKVIVLWSLHSVTSSFVIDEAGVARDQHKLVPLLIDNVSPPLGFGNLHAIATDDCLKGIDAIVAALENKSPPIGSAVGNPFRSHHLATLLSVTAVIAVVGFGAFVLLSRPDSPNDADPKQDAVAAQRDFDAVQAIYSNVKNDKITCKGIKGLIMKLQNYQGNTLPMPKDAAYSVSRIGRKESPTIGDLAVDRMTLIRDVRRECF